MAEERKIWVTLTGLPLAIELEWPFHQSASGADFWVIHGDISIVGTGLHALVSVNLSATVREVLPSLEQKDAEAPVINALRKEVDRRQIEFAKSGKLLPVAFSSRHYDFKRGKWVFGKASDEAIAEFVERKVYWQTKSNSPPSHTEYEKGGAPTNFPPKRKDGLDGAPAKDGAPGVGDGAVEEQVPHPRSARVRNDIANHDVINDDTVNKVWMGDPAEAQYLETTPAHLTEIAERLVAKDLIRMDGEFALATAALLGQAKRFEAAMRATIEALEKKHAYERG
jgi:hypothetical protein